MNAYDSNNNILYDTDQFLNIVNHISNIYELSYLLN